MKKTDKKISVAMFGQKNLSRDGGVELVVQELAKRLVREGYDVTCFNRYDSTPNDSSTEYKQIKQKNVLTIQKKGLAAVSSSFFASCHSALGKYDVVHIHAEGPAYFSFIPKLFGKKVIVTIHGECEIIWATRQKPEFMRVYAA